MKLERGYEQFSETNICATVPLDQQHKTIVLCRRDASHQQRMETQLVWVLKE